MAILNQTMTAVYGIHFLFSLRNTFLSNDCRHLYRFSVVKSPYKENTRSTNTSDDGAATISIAQGGSSFSLSLFCVRISHHVLPLPCFTCRPIIGIVQHVVDGKFISSSADWSSWRRRAWLQLLYQELEAFQQWWLRRTRCLLLSSWCRRSRVTN